MGFEYIVCDSPAGIETGALMAMHFADEALVVTNPEVSSVRDSDRILGHAASKTQRAIDGKEPVKEHLLITRYNPHRVDQGEMLSVEDMQDILRIPLIGVIPKSRIGAARHPTTARPWCWTPSPRRARPIGTRSAAISASSSSSAIASERGGFFGFGFVNRLWRRSA